MGKTEAWGPAPNIRPNTPPKGQNPPVYLKCLNCGAIPEKNEANCEYCGKLLPYKPVPPPIRLVKDDKRGVPGVGDD